MYNRPPIDLALYAIVTKAIPPYRVMLSELLTNSRSSRAATCSNSQRALKRAWERLRKVPLHGSYSTDVSRWTCDCGSQKYHANLLCKHLVQAVGPLPADWWPTVIRFHIPPFYTVPIDGSIAPAPETMRDHAWIPRMRGKRSAIIRRQPERALPDEDTSGYDSDVNIPSVRGRASSPITSSPDKAPHTGTSGIPRTCTEDGSEYELEDADSLDSDELENCLATAIEIVQEQSKNPDPRFLNHAKRHALRGAIRWVCSHNLRPVPNLEDLPVEDLIRFLEDALTLFQTLRDQMDTGGIQDIKERLRGALQWVADIEHLESRRTMPRTNVHPRPGNVIGYRYRERP
ncbi:hypothetical protein C2E23DRAFT_723867 [Lenzites betulinus]|nr:hypothetical protein C2E23DRAFT_723867 [Lenzites betulinus]